MIRALPLTVLLPVLCSSTAPAREWHVPSEVSTIQAAIDSAADEGDTVSVAPGEYAESLSVIAKDLTLLGTGGPESTILSGTAASGDSSAILTLRFVERVSLISGFTFRGGISTDTTLGGGALLCSYIASPRIEGNVFEDNSAVSGGAIFIRTSGPLIADNVFRNNSATRGGAINVFSSLDLVINGNLFVENTATGGYLEGIGGAIRIDNSFGTTDSVTANVFLRNAAWSGGAIGTSGGTSVVVDGNTMVQNAALGTSQGVAGGVRIDFSYITLTNNIIALSGNGWGISWNGPGSITLGCNDVWQNDLGGHYGVAEVSADFSADPLFCDAGTGDYRLQEGSPCLPENSGSCGLVGALAQLCGSTPVVLVRLEVERLAPSTAVLEWEVAGAEDHAGFHVYRGSHPRERLTDHLLTGQAEYAFTDRSAPSGKTEYRLAELSRAGEISWHGPVVLPPASPTARLVLAPPAPNPFAGKTRITYTLPERAPVVLSVYDLQGRRVAALVDREQAAGRYTVTWESPEAAAGLYVVRLQAGETVMARKVMLVR